jgi:hypothetical protein
MPRGGPQPLGSRPSRSAPGWASTRSSGFCALSLEILWFRLLELAVKATAFTFGTMLALVPPRARPSGACSGRRFVARLRRPLRAFLLCQWLLLAYAGAAVCLLTFLPAESALDRLVLALLADRTAASTWAPSRIRPRSLPPLRLPACGALRAADGPDGLRVPVLQRAVQDDPRTSGRQGRPAAGANIAGCMAGSLASACWRSPGSARRGTLRLLMVAGVLFAAIGLRASAHASRSLRSPSLLALGVVLPGPARLWLRLHGTTEPASLVDEDATGVAAILPAGVRSGGCTWAGRATAGCRSAASTARSARRPPWCTRPRWTSRSSAWARRTRPGRRLPARDALGHVFEISGAAAAPAARAGRARRLPDLRRFLADRASAWCRRRPQRAWRETALYDVIEATRCGPRSRTPATSTRPSSSRSARAS